ncbi:DUF3515 domain-containing protein [Allostreptomyces psammosilenae]|uniref:DUF3515 domain-containing protein n=1 Tax=Allostreptomyces psammosilenae TaxID=1892865 RepID=A0A852ZW13_9ACTN|nr:DUF3515 domain-containing protein [Allostreptomyces psammosilenae]NYI06583.1 hypothetical protein [Allostreptomyces psammosilenae]
MPGTSRIGRAAPAAAGLGLLLAAATGCGPVEVDPPSPEGAAVASCDALMAELPATVYDLAEVETEPASPYVRAWGDPAIVLRCGVPRPAVLTPGTEGYDPLSDAVGVNDVDWLFERTEDGYRFTTVQREAFVEVTVPGEYAPETGALTDLADPVRRAVPSVFE